MCVCTRTCMRKRIPCVCMHANPVNWLSSSLGPGKPRTSTRCSLRPIWRQAPALLPTLSPAQAAAAWQSFGIVSFNWGINDLKGRRSRVHRVAMRTTSLVHDHKCIVTSITASCRRKRNRAEGIETVQHKHGITSTMHARPPQSQPTCI